MSKRQTEWVDRNTGDVVWRNNCSGCCTIVELSLQTILNKIKTFIIDRQIELLEDGECVLNSLSRTCSCMLFDLVYHILNT